MSVPTALSAPHDYTPDEYGHCADCGRVAIADVHADYARIRQQAWDDARRHYAQRLVELSLDELQRQDPDGLSRGLVLASTKLREGGDF